MKNIDVLKAMDVNDMASAIKGIAVKVLGHYAPDAEISNFDEADIENSIRRFLNKEYRGRREG